MKHRKPLSGSRNAAAGVVDEGGNQDPNAAGNVVAGVEVPKPNIKFCGRKYWDRPKRKVLREDLPVETIVDGGDVLILPPAAVQLSNRLFYHAEASRIVQLFPHLYKLVTAKGKK
jgi:hypothetical protein